MLKKIAHHFATTMRRNRSTLGATAIEYGLIAAGISIAIIVVIQVMGDRLNSTFTKPTPPTTQQSR